MSPEIAPRAVRMSARLGADWGTVMGNVYIDRSFRIAEEGNPLADAKSSAELAS
jgi:hypothetical protein